ncbi:conserved Plasmodium protein, unknown function [Plasmodium malariae]|uniref:Uncharacterized protein n=1 Tax=Plasmodium malariae TaxID=5858 RepID=A0A1D3JK49_PLAMA|nr:conserved Plasmodium protein, unknown function [Plasmodium malariae]SBT86887.1 conserved Plasmodium protein, unknown function [Plasmodium malariae]
MHCPFTLFYFVTLLFKLFSFAIRNYKKYKVRTYIALSAQRGPKYYLFRSSCEEINILSVEKNAKLLQPFLIRSIDDNGYDDNGYDDNGYDDNGDSENGDSENGDDKDDITYEDIKEYLKKNKIDDYETDDGKKEIMKIINYIPTLKNENAFFSKFGYVNGEKKSMEYYFNEMKKLKEEKQKKNYNILNFILSYFLKKGRNFNGSTAINKYKNIQSYYYYINTLINHREAALTVPYGELSRKDNLFSNKALCKFISFYLKNVYIIKYVCFACLSGTLTYAMKTMIRRIKLENLFLLENHINLISYFKNMHIYKIGLFCLLINFLCINKYNQYFSITEEFFSILFSHYFFYEGINNLNKRSIEEFMSKFNYTLDDILICLNDIFSQYLNKVIYIDEMMDDNTISNINSFLSLYHTLFRNNIENIKSITNLILNKYYAYCINKDNSNKDALSRLYYIFYIISLKFKYDIVDVHKLNIIRENTYSIPFFCRSNKLSSYVFLDRISEHLGVKENAIIDCLLERMKGDYRDYIISVLDSKRYSNNVFEDVNKMNFITLDTRVIEEVNLSIFVKMVKRIIEEEHYESVYVQPNQTGQRKAVVREDEKEKGKQKESYQENYENREREGGTHDKYTPEHNVQDKDNSNNLIYPQKDIYLKNGEEPVLTYKHDANRTNNTMKGNSDSSDVQRKESKEDETNGEGDDQTNIDKEDEISYEGDNEAAYEEEEDVEAIDKQDDFTFLDTDENLYKNLEESVDYIVEDSTKKSVGKDKVEGDHLEKKRKELSEKEQLLKKLNDIYFLRKYFIIDKHFTDKYLEKYLYQYMYKEYKIFINNLIFKKMKNKNDNLFFLKRGITLSNRATEYIIKNIIINFVIKTKENINIFLKLENINKCLKLVVNLINVYKKVKKKRKYLKVSHNIFNLDYSFSWNRHSENNMANTDGYDQNNGEQYFYENDDETMETMEAVQLGGRGKQGKRQSEDDDMRSGVMQNGGMQSGGMQSGGMQSGGMQSGGMQRDDMQIDDMQSGGMQRDDMQIDDMQMDDIHAYDNGRESFMHDVQVPEEQLKHNLHKDDFSDEVGNKEILLLEDRKKLYEEFVLKYMKNESERKMFKIIFNVDYDYIDKEIEDNIIKRFLEKVTSQNLNDLKNMDDNLKIIGNENLFNYKNFNFNEFLEKDKSQRSHKQDNLYVANYIIKKQDIFECIDDETFEDICKKMYINKLLVLKENIYNSRKDLYFYEIILNIKNAQEIHDLYLIDEYEKMINDIIKTNILNKNYGNIKNLYLKKIINFLNISEEQAADVELCCIFKQTHSIFSTIKENFYIYKSDSHFINNINEILLIYNNFNLIKKEGEKYYVKFSLIEPNYNLVHRIIERYVLYVIDIINDENRLIYKENIFKLTRILNVDHSVISDISTKIYEKYIKSQDLNAINNMDSFFTFLFNMNSKEQNKIVLNHLKKKLEYYMTSSDSCQEKLKNSYDLLTFINNNLKLKKNIFDLSSLSTEMIYEFLTFCIDDYLHRKKTESFIVSQNDYINNLNKFLSKIKTFIKGQEESFHLTNILNTLKRDTIKKAIDFLDKFKYDMCIEEIYNLIKLQMVNSNINFADVDIEKRKKLVNIFSYQNISDEKKFLFLDILNKTLL